MKNLFKSLMLVAVAAMAFTACSQDNNELNNLTKKTVFNFQANIGEDTRSGFMEKEEGATSYKSEWFGDETIKVFVTNYNDYNAVTTASINAEGKFSFELENAPENFFVTVCSPAESWESEYTAIIPTEQTPLANSVDPKAHLLNTAGAVYVQNGVADKINMTHQVAYGKMTVNGVDFEIDHVVIDLVGSFYGSARELSYTINADNVENNTFWFATEPIDVAEFTVTVYDADDNAVAKTVDVAAAGKNLSFNYGRVGTFSVSGLEEVVKPDTVMDSAKYYFDYNNYGGYDDWGYVVFEDEYLGTLVLNCTFTDGLYLDICTYSYQSNELGVRFDAGYSYYNQVGEIPSKVNYLSKMTVDVVDGKYSIDLDIVNVDNKTLKATYVGDIEGLGYPDLRAQLAAPNVTATAEGNVITISWDAVIGADKYVVESYDFETKETTETSVTFEGDYSTTYNFSVKAVTLDSNPDYKSSNPCYVSVTTERDPNVVVVEFTSMSYVGTEDTYPMYGEYCHVFELTNSNNYKMNLYVGSYQASSITISEGSYHYEGKENLGYESAQWGFQSKVWNADGYVGAASNNSTMVVKRSGDVYNIDFTLIINNQTHFFVCNAPIGVQQQPVALETPVVSSSVNGNEVVVSWSAINGAANYTVTLGTQSQTVNGTTVTFSNLEYSTSYTVSVVANPADTTANLASDAGTATFTTEEDPNAGGNEGGNDGGNDEWTGREVRLQLLSYYDNVLYTNVNNEGKYFMTSFRNGIVDGTFVLAGDNKSWEISTSGHATSQYGLFGGTTPFADGDTVEVINNGGGSYTIIYRVTINGEKLTATYTGGLS